MSAVLRPAEAVRPGDRITHPHTGERLTVSMVTESSPPPPAGLPPQPPQLKIMVYEWGEDRYLTVSPHTEV